MATYNGERYITEQINSIQAQSETNWQLLIRDDGSTDGTLDQLSKLVKNDPRIRIVLDTKGSAGGACHNFSYLMEAGLKTASQWFFFSDQDDIWHPQKLTTQLETLRKYQSSDCVLA